MPDITSIYITNIYINTNQRSQPHEKKRLQPNADRSEKPRSCKPNIQQFGVTDAFHERLLQDGAQIQSQFLDPLSRDGAVSRTEQGRTTHIVQDPSQTVSLHVIIRQDMASPEHWRQIEQARTDLLQQYGIQLQIVIIP